MKPIVTDGAALSVCRSVYVSVTIVSPAKTAEAIEILFALWTRAGPRNHVLDGGPDPPVRRAILKGKGAAHCKVQGPSAVSCAKTAVQKRLDRTGCRLGYGHEWAKEACVNATCRIRLNCPCSVANYLDHLFHSLPTANPLTV